MKLLLDHNLSPKLSRLLGEIADEVVHVDSLGMAEESDDEIWRFAGKGGFAVVTKDADFLEKSVRLGHPPKVIHLQIGNCTVKKMASALTSRSDEVKSFLNEGATSYLVIQ